MSDAAVVVATGAVPQGRWRIVLEDGRDIAPCFHCRIAGFAGTGPSVERSLLWDGPGAGVARRWQTQNPLTLHVAGEARLRFAAHADRALVCIFRLDNATEDPHVPGVASLLYDALRELHPGALVNHGQRSEAGQAWWNRYCASRGVDPHSVRSWARPADGASGVRHSGPGLDG